MLNAPMAAYQSRDWSFGMGPQIDRTLRRKTIENRRGFQLIFVSLNFQLFEQYFAKFERFDKN